MAVEVVVEVGERNAIALGRELTLEKGTEDAKSAALRGLREVGGAITVGGGEMVAEQIRVAEELGTVLEQLTTAQVAQIGVFDQLKPGLPEGHLGGPAKSEKQLETGGAGQGHRGDVSSNSGQPSGRVRSRKLAIWAERPWPARARICSGVNSSAVLGGRASRRGGEGPSRRGARGARQGGWRGRRSYRFRADRGWR